jgi:hypothetical protein
MSFSPTFQHQLDTIDWRRAKNIFVVCLIAAGAFSGGNWFRSIKDQERSLPGIERAAAALPKIQAEAGCEHWRAGVATKLALSPNMVAPAQIPKDCAHPGVPPAETRAAK